MDTQLTGYSGAALGIIRQSYFQIPFRREETYINGLGTAFLTELRAGDELIIDGTEVYVSQILSNTQFRIRDDFTHSLGTSSTFYKKKKIHGYFLEGTREGGKTLIAGNTGLKWTNASTIVTTGGTGGGSSTPTQYTMGQNTITLPSAGNLVTQGQYNFVKITGAGGAPVLLTGQVYFSSTSQIAGTNTAFTTQLYIGAEIAVYGQYLTVSSITSDILLTVTQTVVATAVTQLTPIYRTTPLYTVITSVTSATITLQHPLRANLYSNGANPPLVYYPGTGADFIEYVYSAPNKLAEATTLALNTSYDRKFVGFRFYPLMNNVSVPVNGVITGYTPITSGTSQTPGSSLGGWSTPVYERWTGGYAGAGGVGINLADCSGGNVFLGTQSSTTFTLNQTVSGTMIVPTTSAQYAPLALGPVGSLTGNITTVTGTVNAATSTYTTVGSTTIASESVFIGGVSSAIDTQVGTQTTGGFIYLFATPRYFVIQGKSFANVPTNWIGCVEFERAQTEDAAGTGGLGVGTTSINISTFNITAGIGGVQTNQGLGAGSTLVTPNIATWPCFAYFNGQRFPIGSAQYPTLPNSGGAAAAAVHGGIFSTPRVRNSGGDLVGVNAHIYSACTITTGRWGHQVELVATGSYLATGAPSSNTMPVQPVDALPQIHLGQIVPTYTNVYNSKRFMFSPVVVLGPAYDPDIRGRIYGLKVIPSALGALMDTVSITIDSNFFYDSNVLTGTDHWVLVNTASSQRITIRPGGTSGSTIQQSWRSLEDTSVQSTQGVVTFVNNFRVALPA